MIGLPWVGAGRLIFQGGEAKDIGIFRFPHSPRKFLGYPAFMRA
jgi:hypothetical protein